ncbi:hypothetical protein OSSY52_11910 [Tepiditoga spiralis]|uniref:GGDEF domain-containing protein n=1 Tax=Tepiditoga spiralis TaxID=2108365 RepID=A0A7G1G3P2_9BACT|nr:sensor domain-containing diguanylate cyclase [Tepiditoga spiralis]BBE31050.1 hypothetical protein OSSY52_11910 [Tepiditoga spiralis]
MNIDFNNFDLFVIKLNKNGEIIYANDFATYLLKTTEEDLLNKNWFNNFLPNEVKKETFEYFKTIISGVNEMTKTHVNEILNSENEKIYVKFFNDVVKNKKNEIIEVISIGIDITEEIKTKKLKESMRKIYKALLDLYEISLNKKNYSEVFKYFLKEAISMIDGINAGSIFLKDNNKNFKCVAIYNYDFKDIKTLSFNEKYFERYKKFFIFNDYKNYYTKVKDKIKNYGIKSSISVPVFVDNEHVAHLFLDSFKGKNALSDLSLSLSKIVSNQLSIFLKRMKVEEKLNKLSMYDFLTDLPNRRYLDQNLGNIFSLAERNKFEIAFVYIDLNKFKCINDKYGHDIGDYVLKKFGKILKESLRKSDFTARLGGDEFLIVLNDVRKEFIEQTLSRLLNKENERINIDGDEFKISISCGVSIFPKDGKNFNTLLMKADKAMYKAKKSKKLYEFY